MPQRLEVHQEDFSGGLNLVTDPYRLKKNQMFRMRNLLLEQQGGLSTRDGYSILTTSPEGAYPVIHRGVLNQSDGTTYTYAILNNATETRLYLTHTLPWTLVGAIPSGNANAQIPQSATMLDAEVFALRNFITPAVYDGTSIVPITSQIGQTTPPGAQHCLYHLGALWLWNTSPATTELDGPSSLRQSDINDYNSWPNSFQTFVGKNDGQQGMGMASYTIAETGISPTQTLVLFKNFSSYQVTGSFGASNFSVQKTKSDMGCIAPRTIQFLSGFGIVRLSHKGFSLFNGVDDVIISEEIRPLIFGDPSGLYGSPGDPIDFATVANSYSFQTFNPLLYVAVCPVTTSSGQCFRFFVYDLVRKAWAVCDLPINFSWVGTIYQPGSQPVVHGAAYTNPVQIVQLFNHDLTDNGSPISWSFTTKPFYFRNFMDRSFFRRCLFALGLTTPQSIDVTVNYLTAPSQNVTLSIPTTASGDTRAGFDMLKKASAVYNLEVEGEGFISVKGIAVQGTTQSLTRAIP